MWGHKQSMGGGRHWIRSTPKLNLFQCCRHCYALLAKINLTFFATLTLITRGGVEDTRLEAKAKVTKNPRPRTQAQVFSKKKRSSKIFFTRSPAKKSSKIFFQAIYKISTIQKTVLSSSRGQANFRGLEALRPRPRTRPSRPRTSKYVLEDVLQAKDVVKDSTSVNYRLCHRTASLTRDNCYSN